MQDMIKSNSSALFDGIVPEDRVAVLSCIGYHVTTYRKGDVIALESEKVKQIGVILSGSVDMIKEDYWGNKTLLLRMGKDEVFGETFACGDDSVSLVTFLVSEDAKIMFMPFCRVMRSCSMACQFHHQLMENMVRIIAKKNRELMRKLEVMSKRTIREKVLAFLSLQAQSQNSGYVELPLGRVELADYLCVDRSALTRELAKMKNEGLLDYDKNCFRLL